MKEGKEEVYILTNMTPFKFLVLFLIISIPWVYESSSFNIFGIMVPYISSFIFIKIIIPNIYSVNFLTLIQAYI